MDAFGHVKRLAADRFAAEPIETHPLMEAIAHDRLSDDAARAVALQIFFVVDHFPRFLAAMLANLDDLELRMPLVENLFVEHGRGRRDEVHVHTYRQFLHALGIGSDDIDRSVPGVGVIAYVRGVMDLCGRQPHPEGLAALAVVEECVARVSPIVGAFARRRGASGPGAHAHFGVHETLDLEHADELYELAARCWDRQPDAVERGLALGGYYQRRLYTDLLPLAAIASSSTTTSPTGAWPVPV